MSLRAARDPDEDEYVSLEGKQSLMAGTGVGEGCWVEGVGVRGGWGLIRARGTLVRLHALQRNVQVCPGLS